MKKLKDNEAHEGKTIRLEAEVIGTPTPDVEWLVFLSPSILFSISSNISFRYKGTKELSNSPKYTITRDGDKCILVINNATPDDIDEYSIKAKNKGGSRMCRCNVNVRCKLMQYIPVDILHPLPLSSTASISFTTKISRCTQL